MKRILGCVCVCEAGALAEMACALTQKLNIGGDQEKLYIIHPTISFPKFYSLYLLTHKTIIVLDSFGGCGGIGGGGFGRWVDFVTHGVGREEGRRKEMIGRMRNKEFI